jgi:putative toxin-antitoxin system antitoxin component (TIGR02293 family)
MSDALTKPALKKNEGKVVSYCVRGQGSRRAASAFTPTELIRLIHTGLPVGELSALQNTIGVTSQQLVQMIGISRATLHRRMASGRLGSAESERVVRFARLMGTAVKVLESEENARKWLRSPQFGLGGAVPLDYAATEMGAREVEDLLGRIEYGVYS